MRNIVQVLVHVPTLRISQLTNSAKRSTDCHRHVTTIDNNVLVKYVPKHRDMPMIFHTRSIFIMSPHVAETPSTNLFFLLLFLTHFCFIVDLCSIVIIYDRKLFPKDGSTFALCMFYPVEFFRNVCVLFLKSSVLPKTDVEGTFFTQHESSCHVSGSSL